MGDTSQLDMTVEDITEVTWEDLVSEMADGDSPDHTVASTGGGCWGVATCVTGYTSTGACVDP